ncbi:MAG: amidohydrolase family protein [Pirellulales bacterium]|nr:amidohydrolase family protein [Pirellulales bacterium]
MHVASPKTAVPVELEQLAADCAAKSKRRAVWLRVGQLIDGFGDNACPDANIVFDAKQIHFVGGPPPAELLPAGQRKPDAELPQHTIMPCLIEAHAHMFLDGTIIDFAARQLGLQQDTNAMLAHARARWPRILASGVGAVRDAGDNRTVGLALAAEAKTMQNKLAASPWIDSPGAAIHHRGRYGAFMGEPIEDFSSAEQCVASRVDRGADRIKLLVSGVIDFEAGRVTTPPQMQAAEIATLVEAASRYGRQTFAHASGTEGIGHAIAGGVTSIEHGYFVTEDQLSRMRDAKIAWVPTLAPVQAQIDHANRLEWNAQVVGHLRRITETHQEMLRVGYRKGVDILAGSDGGSCGVPHGEGLLRELCHMEDAGIPTMGVLQGATGASARVLGFGERIGRLAAGYRGRMILTRHDPLKTVANLQKEKTVLFDGEVATDSRPVDANKH